MVISSPCVISLSATEQAILQARATSARAPYRMVIRARIVLAATRGHTNAAIAAETGMHIDTVRKWRHRFHRLRVAGLEDRPRSGRPPVFTAVQVAEVKQLACTLPAETQIPLSRWSSHELATEATRRGIAESLSASSVRRWLNADAIKDPGSTGPGSFPATPTSLSKPPGYWTSTPAPGKGNPWVMTST